MRNEPNPDLCDFAAEVSATYAAIHRLCPAVHTVTLSHQALRALQVASEPGTTIQSLCRELGCATNTGSDIVRRLVEKALVQKTRSHEDERVVGVRITQAGERVLFEQTGLNTGKLAQGLATLSDEQRREISAGLGLLLSCVGGWSAPAALTDAAPQPVSR